MFKWKKYELAVWRRVRLKFSNPRRKIKMDKNTLNQGRDDKKEDISFHDWILSYLKKFPSAFISIAFAILAVFSLVFPYIHYKIKGGPQILILYGTQLIFIFIITGIIFLGPKPKLHQKYQRGSKAVMQFWKWWPYLWVTWALLYSLLTYHSLLTYLSFPSQNQSQVFLGISIEVFEHIVNNFSSFILIMFFYLFAEPSLAELKYPSEGNIFPDTAIATIRTPNDQIGTRKLEEGGGIETTKLMFWIILLIVATMIEIYLVEFVPGYQESDRKEIIEIFGRFYGILAATATALVVGQLDSKLFGVPKWALIFLFIYAAIQPTFDFLIKGENGSDGIGTSIAKGVIIFVALVGKVLLFTIIHWLAMTGRLLYFMVQNYTFHKKVDYNRLEVMKIINKTVQESN
jgi:hypothetical protein